MLNLFGQGRRNLGKLLATGQLTSYAPGADDGALRVGIVKAYTILTTGQYSGTTNVDLAHLVSDTGAFTAADKTYTDAGKCGVFKAAGGETIVITDSALNNGVFTTVSATANTVVFTQAIVNEADAPMTTFAKRVAFSNACVFDNNTGLMWTRGQSTQIGIGPNFGRVCWTGQLWDAFAFCAACNAAAVGGYTNWRLPNKNDCMSILDNEAPTGVPDATVWPTWNGDIWSSSTTPSATSNAFVLSRIAGSIASVVKTSDTTTYVILVRG